MKWIRTEDKKPRYYKRVQLWGPECDDVDVGHRVPDDCWILDTRTEILNPFSVTHWAPLLEKPVPELKIIDCCYNCAHKAGTIDGVKYLTCIKHTLTPRVDQKCDSYESGI